MSDLYKCGFCDIFFGLMRRVVCSRNNRESSDNCYRELSGENSVRRRPTPSTESSSDLTDTFSPTTDTSTEEIVACRPGRFENELAQIYPATLMSHSFTPSQHHKSKSLTCLYLHDKPTPKIDVGYPNQVEVRLLNHTELWEFDSFRLDMLYGGHGLPVMGLHLLKKYDLIRHFKLQAENCWKFFHLIENHYHQNPYHNSIHALDVAQAVHCFIQEPLLLKHLRKIEILVLLLAAFTHDLDHPGVNQSFLVATHHQLALMYKDKAMGIHDRLPLSQPKKAKFLQRLKFYKTDRSSEKPTTSKKASTSGAFSGRKKKKQNVGSILECHHWRMAFGCIIESGIFANMAAQQKTIKTMLKELILATDITRQHTYLEQFKNLLDRKSLNMNLADHRLLVMQIALKTADISNPGRPWAISEKWSEKVCEEFFNQGDREREMEIPISYSCDRLRDTVPVIQHGFFMRVVLPLYTEWHRYLMSELSLKLLDNLFHNAGDWNWQIDQVRDKKFAEYKRAHAHRRPLSLSMERLLQEAGAMVPRAGPPEAPRRNSYSPTRASKVKVALRRLSAPLHALAEAPRVISGVLQRGELANTVEAERSRSASYRSSRSKSRGSRGKSRGSRVKSRGSRSESRSVSSGSSRSQEHSPSPRPAAPTPTRASRPPLLCGTQLNLSNRGLPAKYTDSTNGVRFGSFAVAEWESDTTSTSGTTTAYPQQLSTLTGSSFTPSSDMCLFPPIMLDNASTYAAGSCEAVVQHTASCEESCDVLPRLIAPELVRRRGSAPVVVAMPATRWQTVYAEPRILSASCNVIAETVPLARRSSLPLMTGISAL